MMTKNRPKKSTQGIENQPDPTKKALKTALWRGTAKWPAKKASVNHAASMAGADA
jgi:hypothetical protein